MNSAGLEWPSIITGEPLKCLVKIKPALGQREDIKIQGSQISLVDPNNRLLEDFDAQEAYSGEISTQQIYDATLAQYLSPFLQGLNVSILCFGSSGSGKSHSLEGTKRDPGLILLYGDALFNLLENKRYQMGRSGKFSFIVKMRYAEIIDEDITDLLALPQDKFGDPIQVNYNEWEGYSLNKCNWVTLSNSSQLSEVFLSGKMRRDNSTGEFGKMSSKSSGVLIIEVIQTFESAETRDTAVVVSRLSFFDLPGSEILLEDPESVKMKQGKTLNRSIITVSNILKDLATGKSEFVYYEASVLSSLMKDTLGANSLGIGIFAIQNGDLKATSLALNYLKFARRVINFPIINDNKSLGLLKLLRAEIIISSKGKAFGDERGTQRVVDLEKKLIEDNLDDIRNAEDRQRLGQKLAELREKFNQLVRSKSELEENLFDVKKTNWSFKGFS